MHIEELARKIEQDIVFGVYQPGSRLIEEPMTKRFAVSRHALRAAFLHLGHQGLVRHIPNRGVEVIEPTPDEIDDLYEVRQILETSAAGITPLPVASAISRALDDIQDRHEHAIATADFRAVFALNMQFHQLQFSTCPNQKLVAAIEEFARKVHVIRAVKYGDTPYMQTVTRQHRDIIAALRGTDNDAYVARVISHLPASSKAYRIAYNIKHGEASPEGQYDKTEAQQ